MARGFVCFIVLCLPSCDSEHDDPEQHPDELIPAECGRWSFTTRSSTKAPESIVHCKNETAGEFHLEIKLDDNKPWTGTIRLPQDGSAENFVKSWATAFHLRLPPNRKAGTIKPLLSADIALEREVIVDGAEALTRWTFRNGPFSATLLLVMTKDQWEFREIDPRQRRNLACILSRFRDGDPEGTPPVQREGGPKFSNLSLALNGKYTFMGFLSEGECLASYLDPVHSKTFLFAIPLSQADKKHGIFATDREFEAVWRIDPHILVCVRKAPRRWQPKSTRTTHDFWLIDPKRNEAEPKELGFEPQNLKLSTNALSPDGRFLVIQDLGTTVYIWNLQTWEARKWDEGKTFIHLGWDQLEGKPVAVFGNASEYLFYDPITHSSRRAIGKTPRYRGWSPDGQLRLKIGTRSLSIEDLSGDVRGRVEVPPEEWEHLHYDSVCWAGTGHIFLNLSRPTFLEIKSMKLHPADASFQGSLSIAPDLKHVVAFRADGVYIGKIEGLGRN